MINWIARVMFVAVFTFLLSSQAISDTGKSVVANGELKADFSSWGKPALQGTWEIINKNGKFYLELKDDFKAKKAPDIKVYLSKKQSSEIDKTNANQDVVLLHLLEKFDGQMQIAIPEGVDFTQYHSLVFHCLKYSKLWGTSPITFNP